MPFKSSRLGLFARKLALPIAIVSAAVVTISHSHQAHAEGVVQMGFGQGLLDHEGVLAQGYASDSASASVYVDILSVGEVINVSLCGAANSDGVEVSYYAPSNDIVPVSTLSQARPIPILRPHKAACGVTHSDSMPSALGRRNPLTQTITRWYQAADPTPITYGNWT